MACLSNPLQQNTLLLTHFTIRDRKNKKAQTGNTTKIKHIDIYVIMFRFVALYPEDGDDDKGDDNVGNVVESREIEHCPVRTGIFEPW